jgi:hypothetical protein
MDGPAAIAMERAVTREEVLPLDAETEEGLAEGSRVAMKRTISMVVLGVLVAGSAALAQEVEEEAQKPQGR